MAGFIGIRAKKRQRKIIIFFALTIVFILFYYILPFFELTETMPSKTLLPSLEETISPQIHLTIEDLEFKLLDRDRKIVFRNNEIKKLKEELKILVKANNQLSDSVIDLSNQQKAVSTVNEKNEDLNKQLEKIKKNNTNEKNNLLKKFEKVVFANKLSKKKYDIIANKNIQLINLQELLEEKIKDQVDVIDGLTLINQELKDNYHRR